MKTTILFLTAVLSVFPAFSRDIKGRILDENNAPLENVNVALYCDSTFVAGGISDSAGLFSISTDTDCELKAKVSFVGYETVISTVPQSGDMGVINIASTPHATAIVEQVQAIPKNHDSKTC